MSENTASEMVEVELDDEDVTAELEAAPAARSYTQEEFDAAFRRRLQREKRKLAETIRADVLSELKEQGKDPDSDLRRQLDAATAKLARYSRMDELVELAEERYDQELAALPEAIRMLAPDEDSDIVDKERWLVTKARPAVERLRKESPKTADTARKGINPADPQPKSPESRATTPESLIRDARTNPIYRRMI
jgi:hypothetical protein